MYKSLFFLLLTVGINAKLFGNTNNEKTDTKIVLAPCNPIISIGTIPNGPFCAGNSFTVPFTFSDCVDAGNIFIVQLSNAVGLFNSPVTIGTLASVNAGSINVTIPLNTAFGNGYRIRILSSAPNTLSADNGFNLTINPTPTANFNINNAVQCLNGNSFTFQNTSTGTISSNIWSFGDGSTTIGTNALRVYNTAGNFNVKLVTTGNNGCKDSIVKQVIVNPKPTVAFTTNQSCINSSIIQANNSTISSGTLNYFWDFGDGSTSTAALPTKTYTTTGSKNIKLVAASDNGCKDSITQTVNISLKPTASFTINNASQCFSGNNFNFTNTSTGSFVNQIWSLGNGVTSNSTSISNYNYPTNGVFAVKLLLIGSNGCNDSITQNVTVSPIPNFTINNATQCLGGNNFIFTNTSIGNLASSSWSFGDGNFANTLNASNSYNAVGIYNVKLKVTEVGGCTDSITKVVQVSEKPNVGFNTSATNFCSGTSLQFNNTSTVGVGTLTYLWSFGDGSTSTQLNPTKAYATAGNYPVKLVVTNNNGCKDSLTQNITILAKPTVAFSVNNASQCINGNQFNFTNNTTGLINSYNWIFGDGTTAAIANPSKTYATTGNYLVKLYANGTNGCVDSASQTVTVNPNPTVDFSFSNSCLNTPIGLTNLSSITNGTVTYNWNFGDATSSTNLNPIKSYNTAGNYTIKLVATSNNGCKDSLSKNINILQKPIPSFSINNNAQCILGNSFLFTNNSTGQVSQFWSFGDGTTATILNATKTYASAGVYVVKLVVTGANGCTDSVAQTVTVSDKPTPAFIINNPAQCLTGNNFVFTDNSTGIIASYAWSFGDGGSSSLQNPSYTYSSLGTFPVKLVVTTTNGCKDSITQNIQVVTKPTASFVINNNNQCVVGNSYSFTNNSTGATSFEWQFGDGGVSNTNNAFYTYNLAGTYVVKLIATNANGCKDSITNTVNVLVKPLASFGINNASQCLNGNNFVLNNTSTAIPNGYLWSFSDGTTSTLTNPTKSFSSVGTYTIKLVVTNTNGCKDSITQTVTVLPKPNPNFTINNTTQCAGSNFIFSNTSSASTTYLWSFGEGTTSASTNPSFVYNIGGLYAVKLVATNSNGCKDSVTQNVNVLVRPSAIFGVNSLSQCINGNNFATTNLSTGNISAYNWSFGNGTFSTLTNPSISYTSIGNYNIKLVATGTNGCKDSLQQTVSVVDKPTVLFSVNNAVQCVTNNNFVFTNSTTGATNYSWSFGDGGTSTLVNPSKVYSSAGSYPVKLIATGNNGCKDSLTQNVSVVSKPIPSFTVNSNNQCITNNNFIFTNASLGGNTFSWNFGDGTTSTLANPNKSFSSPGTYLVKLLVSNATGCIDSISLSVIVHPKPATDFNLNSGSLCLSTPSVSFINNSTGANSYSWDFGDGTFNTLTNPSKTYASFGSYNVKLVSTNSFGCKDSITKTIIIGNKPTANYTINASTTCLGSSFVFTNTSSGSIASQTWDFGDGTTSPTLNPIKSFAVAGIYNVKLVVTGVNGCKDSISQTVTVASKPVPNFAIVGGSACSNTTSISLTNNSTNAVSYVWSFGDGSTSTATNPTYTYAAQGIYVIKLVATGANGCKDSISQTITIATKPIAGYTINNTTQCAAGSPFVFTNTSTGNIASYYWEFGDGIFSTVANPTKVYAVGGTYNVKLVVTGVNGCKDSVTQTVTVASKPVPSFAIVGGSACSNTTSISLTNNSTNAASYVWSFGDGSTSTATNPTYTYASQGIYIIKLVATGANGCKDSISQTITIATKPIAGYTINTTTQCAAGNPFVFTNTSTGNIASYYWEFGDGIFSTVANPTKVYAVGGTYNVKLVVTGVNGCKDSVSQTVTVASKPVPSFAIVGGSACSNTTSISLTNNSTNAVSYVWSFGDGSTSTATNPTYTYAAQGIYIIKLVATGANGCKDSISQTITLSSKPIPSYTVSSTTVCVGSTVLFNNTSTVVGTGYHYWDFGNGIVSTDSNTSVVYTAPGTYTVKYFLTNAANCKDSLFTTINVVAKPTAFFRILGGGFDCVTNLTLIFDNRSGAANNLWTFSDGTSLTSFSPTKTFPSFGTYTVKLVSWNSLGCADSFSTTFTLTPKPVAAFSVNSTTQCTDGNRFVFTNSSTVSNVGLPAYYWTFGDGTVSQDLNPVKTYLQAGTYTVTLFVTNANGCKDSTVRTLTVQPKPVASFTFPNNACSSNNTVAFTNTTTGGTSYVWSFGDGTNSTAVNVSKTYATAGTYIVKLIATNANGCVDSITQSVTIGSKPIAAFSVNSTTQCTDGNRFMFTNSSTVSNVGLPAYYWTFGDGTVSQDLNPVKTYLQAGTYTVTLFVTNANGCKDSTVRTLTVQPKPVASFTFPNNACSSNNTVAFTNTTTGGTSYVWSFGDGTNSTAVNVSKTYATAGTYIVKLIATNANGCVDSITQTVTLSAKPIASFNVNSINGSCAGVSTFSMINTSSKLNVPSYFWEFGNGVTDNTVSPQISYSTPGIYKVKLTVTNANGCVDTAIQFITVQPKPVASFSTLNSLCTNTGIVNFTNTSTGAVSYLWKFHDGTQSNIANASKFYNSFGSFAVKLLVTNASGCVDSIVQNIVVAEKPIASFNVSNNGGSCAGTTVFTMLNTSTRLNSAAYLWQFGNGATATSQNPTITYSTPGLYTIKLTVTNANGCIDTAIQFVNVTAKPTVAFVVNNSNQCLNNNNFAFTPTPSNPAIVSYLWSFGDGTFSTASNPVKTYSAINAYTVKLVATTSNGCIDSSLQTVSVNPAVQANFNASIDLCTSAVTFNNTSTGTSTGFPFTWYFGDGTSTQVANPVKQYSSFGSYSVKLIATNRFCSDSIVKQIFVPQRVSAQFNVNSATQCLKNNVFNFSVASPIAGNTYIWDFGDTTYSTLPIVSKAYTRIGAYTVKLLVRNSNGCVDSTSLLVRVNGTPTPSFIYTSNYICAGTNIQFVNTTNITTGVSYLWSFGDGTFSTDYSPFKSFVFGGSYPVKLVATSASGCKDSAFVNVLVNEPPKPVIATSIVNRCRNVFNFSNTNAGVAPLTYAWNFGDGTTSTVANPQKTYALSSSTINVNLTVTDTFGCTASASTPVNLNFIANTSFSINALQQCFTNNNFQFTNTTTGVPLNTTPFIWYFGDGTSSTSINATKTYAAPGNYVVNLVSISSTGCRDSLSTTVRVNPIPGARISGISNICNGSIANVGIKFFGTPPFNLTYTDGTTNYALNNILTDTINIPVRPSTSTAYRIVQMSDGGSCPVSLAQTTGTALITVIPAPIITRQPVDTGACLGGSTRLYVNVNSSTPVTYQWLKNGIEIVGANTSQLVFNSLQPSDVANYNVKVISSTCGEILSNTVNVSIGIVPTAPVVTNRTVCFNSAVSQLTATGSNLIWYTTSIGGSGTNIAPTPITTVKGSQSYFVTSSNNYCESIRVPLTVTVIDSPKVVLTVSPSTSLLPGQSATITAAISPSTFVPTNYFWFKNGVNVALGTNTFTVPFAEVGTYYVNATIPNACNVRSDSVRISPSLALAQAVAQKRIFIVPNPVRDVAAIYFDAPLNETISVRLIDELGRIRSTQTINYLSAFQKVDLNVRNLVPGYYAIEVLNSKGVSIARDILFKFSR